MKVTEHVEYLLREGRNPAELVELGFPKSVVTRVRKQLRDEKRELHPKIPKGKADTKTRPQPSVASPLEMAPIQQKLASVESQVRELENRVEGLEAISTDLEDIEVRLNSTPDVGLRGRFKCDNCGSEGLVAIYIKCTKCGTATWLGWFPKK